MNNDRNGVVAKAVSYPRAYIYKIVHRFYKSIGATLYFDNGYGIKAMNKKGAPALNIKEEYEENYYLSDELYLGVDALKNEFTHIDIPIDNSPHYGLMKCLLDGKELKYCEYVRLEAKGILDGRFEIAITKKLLDMHKVKFHECLFEIEKNTYKPILIYIANGRKYILDGKHRAALCCLMKKPVRGIVVNSNTLIESQYWQDVYEQMKLNRKVYYKNLIHLEILKDSI